MKNLGLEFKVGLFTLIGLTATGYLFFALSPAAFENKKIKTYYTFLDNAGGIVVKSHVKTNGVSIGKVKGVELGTNNTRIEFEVDDQVKIPKGSTLQVKSVGLLGDSHIEIYRGKDSGEYFDTGDTIPQNTEGTDLSGLIDVAGRIAKDIKKVTGNLADVLGTEDGKRTIANVVSNIEQITVDARGMLNENRDNVKTLIANFKDVSASAKDVLRAENKDKIDRILASFDDAMVDVKAATKNINLISQRVERGEGTLGKLVNDDTALEELQGAIKDIREVLAPATKLQIAVDTHMELRQDKTSQTYFNLQFQTRPDRYYLVGLTDAQYEEREERSLNTTGEECQTADDRCDESRERHIRTKKQLRFNLQFAKRWYFAALRFGLFESTGGFGSDFYLFSDRLRFTMEAFDWRTTDNDVRRVAHLKAYASVLFFNHVYLMAGIDDPTKFETRGDSTKLRKDNMFFGAGISFNDQDLKALFGAAALSSAM